MCIWRLGERDGPCKVSLYLPPLVCDDFGAYIIVFFSGTLYNYLDHCITPFGKRLLRNWICHPLQNIEEINKRLNVVEDMMTHPEIVLLIEQHLRKLSDLERLLGHVKASNGSFSMLSFPFIGEKILKQRVS